MSKVETVSLYKNVI